MLAGYNRTFTSSDRLHITAGVSLQSGRCRLHSGRYRIHSGRRISMIVFLKGLSCGTVVLNAHTSDTVSALKSQIQDVCHLPVCQQILICNGRQLKDEVTCGESSISEGSTVHVTFRLRGGKGGFGALLRGQGRDGKLTTNYDACRDLQGRRLRHVNAEEKLKDWQAQEKERELEKLALQHIKEQQKAERKEKESLVHIDEVREAQKRAVDQVKSAVEAALAAGTAAAEGPSSITNATQAQYTKRPLTFGLDGLDDLDSDSDSNSDSGSDSELTRAPGHPAAKRPASGQLESRALKKPKEVVGTSDSAGSSDAD